MRTNEVIGPRRAQPQTVYWICLNCGIEQDSPDFLQCENGQLINETLKRALAVLCCSEELIQLLIAPDKQTTPPVKKNTEEELKKAHAKGLLENYNKKYFQEFLSPVDIRAVMELLALSDKSKLADENIIRLLNIFKPLLTNHKITKFHHSTRICLACCIRLRKEIYDGGEIIPEIPCPICKAALK